jgi:SHS2 domain-containing protein
MPVSRGHTYFDHTADIGAAVWAPTLRGLFAEASMALNRLICDPRSVRPRQGSLVEVAGSSLEDLLVRWLSEILFLHETRRLVFTACTLQQVDRRILRARGTARGETCDPRRHRLLREVKAVTYHQIALTRSRGVWRVRIVFDV